MKPRFFGQADGGVVVTIHGYWTFNYRHHSKLVHERPHPDDFFYNFVGRYIFGLYRVICHDVLLEAPTAYCSSVESKNISRD